VQIETPTLTAEQLKKAEPEEVMVRAEAEGKAVGEVKMQVLLRASAIPQ
jgi:hypothetical protein